MAVAAVVLFAAARVHQLNQLDRHVEEKARIIASMIELEGDSLDLDFESLDLTEFQSQRGGWYLQVWFGQESIYRSISLGESELHLSWAPEPSGTVNWCTLPRGLRGRGIVLDVSLGEDLQGASGQSDQGRVIDGSPDRSMPDVIVQVARDTSEMLAALRQLAVGLAIVTGGAILAMAVALTQVVNRSMRPVEQLAVMIGQIDASKLNSDLGLTGLPRELEPIVVQFNAMMARLRTAFERERGFCADVAHELRTPLAGLRATLDVTRSRRRSQQDYVRAIDRCRQMVAQTQSLVEALLRMANLEAGQLAARPEWLEVNSELHKRWHDVVDKAATEKKYDIRWNLSADKEIRVDPGMLALVLHNVLANALEYVNDGGVIEVESVSTQGSITVTIANSGSLIGAEEAGKVFERFWRGGQSRSNTGLHFGLGLTLARQAAERMGGTLRVELQRDDVFRAICCLPKENESPRA